MDTIVIPKRNDKPLMRYAASLLLRNDVVAFPTETVYGLGARIFSSEAIAKVYRVKGRPADNPLIAHIADLGMVHSIAQNIPDSFSLLSSAFFPGPLTIVLPKRPEVPDIATAGLDTIGVRMPNHPVALELIRLVGEPLVAPSANLSGKPSPTTAKDVLSDLDGKIPCVIDGGTCEIGIESTVIDITTGQAIILRPGAISREQLEAVLGEHVEVFDKNKHEGRALTSPGMRYRHYAPLAPIELIYDWEQLPSREATEIIMSNAQVPDHVGKYHIYPITTQSLFSTFRIADRLHMEKIYIFVDDELRLQSGLWNRIARASGQEDLI